MSRQQLILIAVALGIGAVISIVQPGIYGVMIAIAVGLGLGWAGSRFGLIKGDDEDET
jgi:hypothetical protein